MLSVPAGEMRKLLDEVRAAIAAAPSGWKAGPAPPQHWTCESQGWRLLIAAWVEDGHEGADGTATKGGTIMRFTPELAWLALQRARGR